MQYQSRTIEDQPLRMASDALRAYPWATGVLSHPNIAEIFPRDYNVRPGLTDLCKSAVFTIPNSNLSEKI